ncbi:MAG: EAL domain-containing protein [Burkholderiales bacterium]|nr:EAL domain-containing protein [Burkholderiales bacterium]
MVSVSWMIRQQYLDQSGAVLNKAAAVVTDDLAKRKDALQKAASQLVSAHNVGSTVWYLAQYAHSNLDRETLFQTYLQLARLVRSTGLAAGASKIQVYDAAGNLMAFTTYEEGGCHVGFVDRLSDTRFYVAKMRRGEEITETSLKLVDSVPKVAPSYTAPLPHERRASYAVVDGRASIEVAVPIIDEATDPTLATPGQKLVGLVVLDQTLGQSFAESLARLTDTDIDVFTGDRLGFGTLPAYQSLMLNTPLNLTAPAKDKIWIDEIKVGAVGYYQGVVPLYAHDQLVGGVAILHSKAPVEQAIWQTIHILGLIAVATLVFVLPITWYFAYSISRPLSVLGAIFRGEANTPAPDASNDAERRLESEARNQDEMGALVRSFIAMRAAVQQKIRQIHEINASLEDTVSMRTAALVVKERESRSLSENSPDSIARYDHDCRRIYANPAFLSMAGQPLDALLGKTPSQNPGGPHAAVYEEKIRRVFATGDNAQFDLKWMGKDGRELCSHIRLTAEVDHDGKVATVLAIGRDISDRLEYEETIWRQANFDTLTSLPNRRMFNDRLEHAARYSHRTGRRMVLMLIDLDHFKEVNDTLGHDQGDQLLAEAARRIVACVRGTDTVARLGGDEFAVILSDVESRESTEQIAESILARLIEPFKIGGEEAYISASIGVTVYPDDASDLNLLFKFADQAMYASKNAGRSSYSFYTQNLHISAQRRLRLSNDLRRALAGEEFEVYYQPIVDLGSGHICKAEALLRWRHPEHGLVSPADFIPLAEETGLIVPISDWVFRQVVQQVKYWRDRDTAFQVTINLSPVQVRRKEAVLAEWMAYLSAEGVSGRSVALEITEGVLLNADSSINDKLLALRDEGIQVAIDDFGTGYSSLAYLKRLDIDYLKIDQAFVQNLATDADNQAMCEAIIVMAHKLSLRVVAEGVETAEQRDFLKAAGCDYAQGYLYAKPMPAHEFERYAWSVDVGL